MHGGLVAAGAAAAAQQRQAATSARTPSRGRENWQNMFLSPFVSRAVSRRPRDDWSDRDPVRSTPLTLQRGIQRIPVSIEKGCFFQPAGTTTLRGSRPRPIAAAEPVRTL